METENPEGQQAQNTEEGNEESHEKHKEDIIEIPSIPRSKSRDDIIESLKPSEPKMPNKYYEHGGHMKGGEGGEDTKRDYAIIKQFTVGINDTDAEYKSIVKSHTDTQNASNSTIVKGVSFDNDDLIYKFGSKTDIDLAFINPKNDLNYTLLPICGGKYDTYPPNGIEEFNYIMSIVEQGVDKDKIDRDEYIKNIQIKLVNMAKDYPTILPLMYKYINARFVNGTRFTAFLETLEIDFDENSITPFTAINKDEPKGIDDSDDEQDAVENANKLMDIMLTTDKKYNILNYFVERADRFVLIICALRPLLKDGKDVSCLRIASRLIIFEHADKSLIKNFKKYNVPSIRNLFANPSSFVNVINNVLTKDNLNMAVQGINDMILKDVCSDDEFNRIKGIINKGDEHKDSKPSIDEPKSITQGATNEFVETCTKMLDTQQSGQELDADDNNEVGDNMFAVGGTKTASSKVSAKASPKVSVNASISMPMQMTGGRASKMHKQNILKIDKVGFRQSLLSKQDFTSIGIFNDFINDHHDLINDINDNAKNSIRLGLSGITFTLKRLLETFPLKRNVQYEFAIHSLEELFMFCARLLPSSWIFTGQLNLRGDIRVYANTILDFFLDISCIIEGICTINFADANAQLKLNKYISYLGMIFDKVCNDIERSGFPYAIGDPLIKQD